MIFNEGTEYFLEEKIIFLTNVSGRTGYLFGKNEASPLPHTIHSNSHEMDHRSNCNSKTIKYLKGDIKENLHNLGLDKDFF